MQIDILYRPSYSLGVIKLDPQESVLVESGAMVSFSYGVTIETQATGGIFKSIARSFLGGESFFQNVFIAPSQGGEVCVAPVLPGDMYAIDMQNENLIVQKGSYVACDPRVSLSAKWGGAKTFLASEGVMMLCAQGAGKLLLSSYGAIHEKELASGETYTVDTGHLVAFTETVGFDVRGVGGLKSTFLSGEGLVVDLTGPGRVLLQTRSTDSFLQWLISKLPVQNKEQKQS